MHRKTDQIRAAWATGDRIGALRIAARFFDRSADTKTFKRGMAAYRHPQFYRQLGKEPQGISKIGLSVKCRPDKGVNCMRERGGKPYIGVDELSEAGRDE